MNKGNALLVLGRYSDALACYQAALACNPDDHQVHAACGSAFHNLGRLEDALNSYDASLRIKPDFIAAHSGRGTVLHDLGRLEEALESHELALTFNPDHAEVRTNRGLTLLLRGQLDRGWQDYEWRWQTKTADPVAIKTRLNSWPQWQGQPGSGRSILLWSEQGLGDSIQFVRYVPAVAAKGWTVVLEVPKPLVRLFEPLATPQVRIVAIGDPLPPTDYQCPLAGLPRAFSTQCKLIPSQVPYLKAEPALRSFWRQLLPVEGMRVGIMWQGNPSHKNDHNRSIPLRSWRRLRQSRGVHLVSLQKEYGLEQLCSLSEHRLFKPWAMHLKSGGFHDTAALIAELDLVVTVDTSVTHLAGHWRVLSGLLFLRSPIGAGRWTVQIALGIPVPGCSAKPVAVIGTKL